MTRLNINIGSSANDGTGDTLRGAGTKINSNFQEIYMQLGGDSNTLSSQITLANDAVIFEGTSDDSHETKLIAINATADRTISIPNATGTIVLKDTTDTLTNKTLTTPTIASITNGGTVTIPSGADTLVARTSTDTLTNKTLTSPTVNTPIIGTSLNDANGNEFIKFGTTASAVNEVTITNKATNTNPSLNAPIIAATGGDANINLALTSKGTGAVSVSKASFAAVTMTASGAISTAATYIIGNKSGGAALVATLDDGIVVGEYKIFTNKGAGTLEVTPDNFAQGAKFTLAVNDGCTCIWDGSNWFLVGNQGEVTIA